MVNALGKEVKKEKEEGETVGTMTTGEGYGSEREGHREKGEKQKPSRRREGKRGGGRVVLAC